MNTLELFELQEAEETIEAEEKEKFEIKDLVQANWALRKISAYHNKLKEVKGLANEEKFRIECWEQNETESINKGIEFFEALLQEFLLENRKVDPKFKVSTPYGKVSTRKQQAKWEYEDNVVLEYLKNIEAKEFIRIKEELNKADLKKVVTVDNGKAIYEGVALPGIAILEQPDKVVVSVEV